jgi:hypothetical protein
MLPCNWSVATVMSAFSVIEAGPDHPHAYMVMGLGHTAFQSYRVLSLVFVENRDDSRGIDRDRRFYIYVKWIQQRVLKIKDATIDISEVWRL